MVASDLEPGQYFMLTTGPVARKVVFKSTRGPINEIVVAEYYDAHPTAPEWARCAVAWKSDAYLRENSEVILCDE